MVPATATFIFCDGHLLVRAGELEPAGAATLAELRRTRAVLDEFTVRPRGDLAVAVSGAACRALGMVNWRATHRFCGRCGGPLAEHPADAAGTCAACGQVEYPSLAPAVIMRVEKAGQILLARHVQRIPDLWTCLAGYVELGESLEDCVRREVREEAGIEVADIRYVASQPWPYPNQLMVGFVAQWKSGELQLQPEELAEARWFDPADLPTIPPKGSMAWRLIRGAF
jgi:NAD+ diphosphatase